jgi:hypothetical protein
MKPMAEELERQFKEGEELEKRIRMNLSRVYYDK